jgi:hypothetical protein
LKLLAAPLSEPLHPPLPHDLVHLFRLPSYLRLDRVDHLESLAKDESLPGMPFSEHTSDALGVCLLLGLKLRTGRFSSDGKGGSASVTGRVKISQGSNCSQCELFTFSDRDCKFISNCKRVGR